MKRTMTFFLLFIKRLCKKPAFVVILLIMPILVLAFCIILKDSDNTVRVALYNDGNDEEIDRVIEDILAKESVVGFYKSDSVSVLRADVLTNTAECGFVFSDGVWEALRNEDAEEMITIYQSTKSTMTDYMKEEVYSLMYRYLAIELLEDYLDEQEVQNTANKAEVYADNKQVVDKVTDNKEVTDKETVDADNMASASEGNTLIMPDEAERNEYLKEHYESYLSDGGVFEITYYDGDKSVTTEISAVAGNKDYLKKPIKGTLSIFMMIASLAGAVFWLTDEKNGVYKTLSFRERPYINLMVTFIPTMLSCIVAFACLYIGGIEEGFFTELVRMFSYSLLLTGMSNLLRIIIKNEVLLCSMLTMLIVVCLACCNIVLNLALYVPGIKLIRWLLAPNYYLDTMKNAKGILLTLAIGIILILIGIFADRKHNA